MELELSEEEARALARHLREALEYARYPYAPRLDPLKAILARLEPAKGPHERVPLATPRRVGRGAR
jgi:hypothetical protein